MKNFEVGDLVTYSETYGQHTVEFGLEVLAVLPDTGELRVLLCSHRPHPKYARGNVVATVPASACERRAPNPARAVIPPVLRIVFELDDPPAEEE